MTTRCPACNKPMRPMALKGSPSVQNFAVGAVVEFDLDALAQECLKRGHAACWPFVCSNPDCAEKEKPTYVPEFME